MPKVTPCSLWLKAETARRSKHSAKVCVPIMEIRLQFAGSQWICCTAMQKVFGKTFRMRRSCTIDITSWSWQGKPAHTLASRCQQQGEKSKADTWAAAHTSGYASSCNEQAQISRAASGRSEATSGTSRTNKHLNAYLSQPPTSLLGGHWRYAAPCRISTVRHPRMDLHCSNGGVDGPAEADCVHSRSSPRRFDSTGKVSSATSNIALHRAPSRPSMASSNSQNAEPEDSAI